MWDLPGPGIEPTSPALAGVFLTPGPPGKSQLLPLLKVLYLCVTASVVCWIVCLTNRCENNLRLRIIFPSKGILFATARPVRAFINLEPLNPISRLEAPWTSEVTWHWPANPNKVWVYFLFTFRGLC